MRSPSKIFIGTLVAVALAGCTGPSEDVALLEGPPIADIVTPFDDALVCLNGKIAKQLTFAVGGIPDSTGREQHNNDGAGKFVTQGAGDMVQSALFKTGVTLLNRRDMGSAALEAQWGIRTMQTQRPANLVISGSINSLDFIPGGGSYAGINGVGPRYQQNRILVGIDMAMTNANTGAIVANISLRKQIFADEMGLMAARFSDDIYFDVDFGGSRREAIHFALRQMLQLATFELLTQLMPPEQYADCRELIDARYGTITGDRTTGEQIREMEASEQAAQESEENSTVESDEQVSDVSPADETTSSETTASQNPNLERDEVGRDTTDVAVVESSENPTVLTSSADANRDANVGEAAPSDLRVEMERDFVLSSLQRSATRVVGREELTSALLISTKSEAVE